MRSGSSSATVCLARKEHRHKQNTARRPGPSNWLDSDVWAHRDAGCGLADHTTPAPSPPPRKPAKITVTTEAFVRAPGVVAEALYRADGKYEICHGDAPFLRRNGRPYLEVHHLVQPTAGGEGTMENAVAVCPNCHRQAHYGAPRQE
ncbi:MULTISPECIES: HNH endonuclease [Burkholderia]|uniref:HNH endonuclease n=1 Tax=Burkholderia TaxID=32008 RepID=UPI000B7A330A|nr:MULTISPECIES: HNH endonuclease [Burkholderia]OXJ00866.1 hypothetical protein CFB41_14705 [Burkholderia sp. AU33803]PRD94990.1 hypothetical protein C6P88_08170 [Burkholderia contaminans]